MSSNASEKAQTGKGKAKKAPVVAPRLKVSPKLAILQDVIALMGEAQINEVLFEQGGVKIHLRKGLAAPMEGALMPTMMAPAPVMAAAPQVAPALASSPAAPVASEKGVKINAPMVGTFYRAPAPDAKPFVQEGARIEVGQVFCIIEAMKLMNEIKSEVSGKIVKILASNGQAVEFGQPLLVVDPS